MFKNDFFLLTKCNTNLTGTAYTGPDRLQALRHTGCAVCKRKRSFTSLSDEVVYHFVSEPLAGPYGELRSGTRSSEIAEPCVDEIRF